MFWTIFTLTIIIVILFKLTKKKNPESNLPFGFKKFDPKLEELEVELGSIYILKDGKKIAVKDNTTLFEVYDNEDKILYYCKDAL